MYAGISEWRRTSAPTGDGSLKGPEKFSDNCGYTIEWAEEPVVVADNRPCSDLHCPSKWQGHRAGGNGASSLIADEGDELTLAQRVQAASPGELLGLAPQLEVHAFETTKEEALRAAVLIGRTAQDTDDPELAGALRRPALALIASAALRARDAHNPDFLVEALEAMQAAGVGEPEYVDMLLAALYAQLSQGAKLSPELALRGARALGWAATALAPSMSGSLELAPAARRAVVAIWRALAGCPLPPGLAAALDALGRLRATGCP